jgi:hypothetical protein
MTILRTLLLSLFLLFAQQGSLLHALSHGTVEHRKLEGQGKSPSVCEKCISYTTAGSALNSAAFSLPVHAATPTNIIQFNQYIKSSPAPTPSERGPPAILLT